MTILRYALGASALMLLSACASTGTTTSDETVQTAQAVQAAPVATAPAATATAPVATADAGDPERQICKSQTVIGSKFRKKICGTAAYWAEVEANARASSDDMQRRGAMGHVESGS
ncbi:MAG: hypothetical protein AAF311_12985 [Pseudomonadota bacterium]